MDQKELDFVQVLKTFSGGESDQEFLYRLSPLCKLLLWFITLSSLAIGWIMKSVIFKYIAKTGFKDQPINLMILTEQIVHFVSGSFFFSWASVMILSASITVFYCVESITNRPLYFICIGRDRNLEVKYLLLKYDSCSSMS